jgi:hypothetical protein
MRPNSASAWARPGGTIPVCSVRMMPVAGTAELERAGQAQQVVPVLGDQVELDRLAGQAVELP